MARKENKERSLGPKQTHHHQQQRSRRSFDPNQPESDVAVAQAALEAPPNRQRQQEIGRWKVLRTLSRHRDLGEQPEKLLHVRLRARSRIEWARWIVQIIVPLVAAHRHHNRRAYRLGRPPTVGASHRARHGIPPRAHLSRGAVPHPGGDGG